MAVSVMNVLVFPDEDSVVLTRILQVIVRRHARRRVRLPPLSARFSVLDVASQRLAFFVDQTRVGQSWQEVKSLKEIQIKIYFLDKIIQGDFQLLRIFTHYL